jgi:hypothetical protein
VTVRTMLIEIRVSADGGVPGHHFSRTDAQSPRSSTKILRGAGDLPFAQVTKFEPIINLKTTRPLA